MKLYLSLLILFSVIGTNVYAATNPNMALCWYSNYGNTYEQAAYIDITDDPEVSEGQLKGFFASEFKRTVGKEAWASYCSHRDYENVLPYLRRDNTTIHRFKLSPIKAYVICKVVQVSSMNQFEFIKEFPSSTKAQIFVKENFAKFEAFAQEQYGESGQCAFTYAEEFAAHQSKHSTENNYKHVAIKWDPAKSVAKTPEKRQSVPDSELATRKANDEMDAAVANALGKAKQNAGGKQSSGHLTIDDSWSKEQARIRKEYEAQVERAHKRDEANRAKAAAITAATKAEQESAARRGKATPCEKAGCASKQ